MYWLLCSELDSIDRILDSVPAGSELGLNAVLFLRTMEKSLSSSALECGIVKTTLPTFVSLGNLVRNYQDTSVMTNSAITHPFYGRPAFHHP